MTTAKIMITYMIGPACKTTKIAFDRKYLNKEVERCKAPSMFEKTLTLVCFYHSVGCWHCRGDFLGLPLLPPHLSFSSLLPVCFSRARRPFLCILLKLSSSQDCSANRQSKFFSSEVDLMDDSLPYDPTPSDRSLAACACILRLFWRRRASCVFSLTLPCNRKIYIHSLDLLLNRLENFLKCIILCD